MSNNEDTFDLVKEQEFEFLLNDQICIRYNVTNDIWYAHHWDEESFDEDEIIDEFEDELELFGEYALTSETFSIMKDIVKTEEFTD